MAEYIYDRIFAPADVIKAAAETHGTPFYLYHKQGIVDSIQNIHSSFSRMPGYQNYFLIRENNNPELLKLLAKVGTGVNACSLMELELAKACGFCGEQIIYQPTLQDIQAEMLAKELNAAWLINSPNLLPETLPEKIILHYHPSEERMNAIQFQKVERSKNGFKKKELFEIIVDLHQRGVTQLGLALQISSYSIQPGFWAKKAELLLSIAKALKENYGITLWSVHLGEGPGLPYNPRVQAPSVQEEADRVKALYESLPEDLRPAIFTGVNRRLMEQNGILITKILEERKLHKTFLVLDAGICHYIRPALKRAYRHVSVLGKNQIEGRRLYTLTGQLPDDLDHPAQKGRMLPPVTPGDYCVFHDVGCGGRSMAMLYGCSTVAAEFLYEEDGSVRPIAPGRSPQEVFDFLTAW